ncbi:Uncharacterised protein [Segatella copri]|nr:Uncharacterised protein [Segatella copri]
MNLVTTFSVRTTKNGKLNSFARALAVIVFPVPDAPYNRSFRRFANPYLLRVSFFRYSLMTLSSFSFNS